MPLLPTQELIEQAGNQGCALGAFNVICHEHAEAISAAAEQSGRPAILQISENAVRYHRGEPIPIALACAAVAEASPARLALHLDHVTDTALLHQAPKARCSSVMFDASTSDYRGNVRRTRDAADWAHGRGLWIEAELGAIGGKQGPHAPGARTDPDQAREFVEITGVDGLAVAIGSSHAMTTQTAELDLDLLRRIRAVVPVPLVLHGSSGIPDPVLAEAAAQGMAKVNVGTALNLAYTRAVRAVLIEHPDCVDPRAYLAPARDQMTRTVRHVQEVLAGAARPGQSTQAGSFPGCDRTAQN